MDLFSSILKRRQIRAADRNRRKEFDLTMPKPVGLEQAVKRTAPMAMFLHRLSSCTG